MTANADLAELLVEPGPWTFAYVNGPGAEPQVVEESRRDSVRDRLLELGAPEQDARAVLRALEQATGVSSPSARYLLVRGGEVALDASFAQPRRGSERLGHGPVPEILPLLRHRASSIRYLVVETGREGADVRVESADRSAPQHVVEVEGRDDSLPKVQAGGWSHARYQRHSEEIWKHNQSEVAEVVDRLVREERPVVVVLAGDLRARQLLRERLAPASRELVVEVEAHTRAAGSDERVLDDAIADALTERTHRAVEEALDRASAENGSRGARGMGAVVEALQQARVETLLIDGRSIDAEQTDVESGEDGEGRRGAERLEALDSPPWVALGGASVPGEAASLGSRPADEALARAAILTGAQLHVLEEDYAAADEPRPDRAPRQPVAVLRWTESPAGP